MAKKTTKKATTKKASAKKAPTAPKAATAARAAKGGKRAATPRTKAKDATRANDAGPKAKPAKRPSLLDAAAAVLAEHPDGLHAREMIEEIAKRGLWASPRGKTPHATLYAAIIREIGARGLDARFAKRERGLFMRA